MFRIGMGMRLASKRAATAALCLALGLLDLQFSSVALDAQVITSISGVVTVKGTVIPKAQVTIKNQATGQVWTTRTDSSGQYRLDGIPAGVYDIAVDVSGFAESVQAGVSLGPGMASSANFDLSVGAAPRVTSREILAANEGEAAGFGLYSYILFGAPPNDATRGRYLATLRSYLDLPSTKALLKHMSKKQLNITYVPLDKQPSTVSAEQLLAVYDYARAQSLLAKLPGGPYIQGPYIVSTTDRLSKQQAIADHYLYQNLSSVPSDVVPLWVEEFMKQSAQQDFWQKRRGPQIALELRTVIATLAAALPNTDKSLAQWKEYLSTLLVWKEKS